TIQSTHGTLTNFTAGSGNDTIYVQTVAGTVNVAAGPGTDTVNVGSTTNLLSGIQATAFTITAGAGTDTLNITDAGDGTGRAGTLTATTLTGLTMSAAGIVYSGAEFVNLTLGGGGDAFYVDTTPANTTLVVVAAGGDDTVNVHTIAGPTT